MLKMPGWEMSIVWYFFLGGIAGGAYFTAAIADNFGSSRDRAVARVGYLLSLPLVAVCGVLLIVDLGVPARFMNMMLHFKFWDPMSIGAWAVGIFGAFTFVSSVLSFSSSESAASLRRKFSLVGMLFGFFLAGYTGVLLSNSAMPFWGDSRLMGALFLASGGSTGMAAVALTMFLSGRSMGESWHKIEVADRFSMLVELLVLAIFLGVLGSAAQPITSGHLGSLFWGGLVGAGLIVPLLLNVLGGRMRALGAVSAALVLVGGFILRYVVVMSIQG
jgi:formate-dependent nitrite reductase membrane component NrfD